MLFYLDLSKLALKSALFRPYPLLFQIFFVYLHRIPRVTGNAEVRPVSVGAQGSAGLLGRRFYLVLFFYQWNRH